MGIRCCLLCPSKSLPRADRKGDPCVEAHMVLTGPTGGALRWTCSLGKGHACLRAQGKLMQGQPVYPRSGLWLLAPWTLGEVEEQL